MGLSPVLVSPPELRQRFEAGRYLERADAGEFTCCLKDECTADSADEPPGTRSITVGYLDGNGHRIFLVHLYLRPAVAGEQAEIGASGRPDPKWLYEGGIVYQAARPEGNVRPR